MEIKKCHKEMQGKREKKKRPRNKATSLFISVSPDANSFDMDGLIFLSKTY